MRITLVGPIVLLTACQEPAPTFSGPLTLGGQVVSARVLERGRLVYGNFCASCHGGDGSGNGPSARALKTKPRDFRAGDFGSGNGDLLPTDDELFRSITDGFPDLGMPGFPHLLEEDRRAVGHYLKTFSPRWRKAESGL